MAATLVNTNKRNGTLYTVTLKLEDAKDNEIFDKLFDAIYPPISCPKCENVVVKSEVTERFVEVDTPLTDSILDFNVALVKCPTCGNKINLGLTDYTSFPSVAEYIVTLRRRYNQKINAKGGK